MNIQKESFSLISKSSSKRKRNKMAIITGWRIAVFLAFVFSIWRATKTKQPIKVIGKTESNERVEDMAVTCFEYTISTSQNLGCYLDYQRFLECFRAKTGPAAFDTALGTLNEGQIKKHLCDRTDASCPLK